MYLLSGRNETRTDPHTRVFLLLTMTIKEARKILGKQAQGVSDEMLEKDIEIAELLKNLFFNMVANAWKPSKKSGKTLLNMP